MIELGAEIVAETLGQHASSAVGRNQLFERYLPNTVGLLLHGVDLDEKFPLAGQDEPLTQVDDDPAMANELMHARVALAKHFYTEERPLTFDNFNSIPVIRNGRVLCRAVVLTDPEGLDFGPFKDLMSMTRRNTAKHTVMIDRKKKDAREAFTVEVNRAMVTHAIARFIASGGRVPPKSETGDSRMPGPAPFTWITGKPPDDVDMEHQTHVAASVDNRDISSTHRMRSQAGRWSRGSYRPGIIVPAS